MITNRCSALLLAVLAFEARAGSADPAGLGPEITLRLDAQGRKTCGDIPLISAAWNSLPPEQGFPCDPDHLAVILDYESFLKAHPDLAASAALREKGRHAFAFSLSGAWPIYINVGLHPALADAFNHSQRWVAFAIAGVLAHERVHAMGNLSEVAGLLAEFQLDKRFQREGKLPQAFDIRVLEQQYHEALNQEKALSQMANGR
jgi:hypothetical protein